MGRVHVRLGCRDKGTVECIPCCASGRSEKNVFSSYWSGYRAWVYMELLRGSEPRKIVDECIFPMSWGRE